MRINIYDEELTNRIEYLTKVVDGITYHGVRIYLYLPVTLRENYHTRQVSGPFLHRDGDDDSSAITLWSSDLPKLHALFREALIKIFDLSKG